MPAAGAPLPQPQQPVRRPIALPQPTRRADEPRDEHRVHEDYTADQGRGLAARGLTELSQPGPGGRGSATGRLDEARPVGSQAEPAPLGAGAQSGDLADADLAGTAALRIERRIPGRQTGVTAPRTEAAGPQFGQFGQFDGPVPGGQPTEARAWPQATGPRFEQSEARVPGAHVTDTGSWPQASQPSGARFAPVERRVTTGQAVVPDRRPVSEVDRAWAAPGTTRSLADVPPHGGLGQAPVRRSRRERVAATAATLAQPPVAEEAVVEHGTEEAEVARERVELSAAPAEETTGAAQPEPPKRQRVTLRAPAVKPLGARAQGGQDLEDSEVRVYAAPLLDGLGKFDLGSVPASVTPPKTWRKAAWFATGASGAVVVGLLFAGTFLVGGPTTTTDALGGGWPGRQNGGNPLILPDPSLGQQGSTGGGPRDSSSGSSRHGTGDTSDSEDPNTHPQNAGGSETSSARTPTDPSSSDSSSAPVTTGAASTPAGPPVKPPITPAPRQTAPTNVWYDTAKNPEKMGDNSEKFFNTVTTDPNEAAAVTTGDLEQEGPQGLRQRYANVAYFEVKKVEIDPDNNTTVNTLEVTHTDGTKTMEQRTLTFGDDDKIADDGA
ncbi:hypothetical protein ACWEOE_08040 [Amycolatopsis sp. NPDC004368]